MPFFMLTSSDAYLLIPGRIVTIADEGDTPRDLIPPRDGGGLNHGRRGADNDAVRGASGDESMEMLGVMPLSVFPQPSDLGPDTSA